MQKVARTRMEASGMGQWDQAAILSNRNNGEPAIT